MSIEKIKNDITIASHLAFDKRVPIQAKYSWKDDDARLTIFNKLNRLLASISLGYFLMETVVQKKEWWKQNQPDLNDQSVTNAFDDFEMLFRIGLIHNLMYCVESSFRIYVKTIDEDVYKKMQGQFKSIYGWLFKKLNLQATNVELLDLFRNIRNTMHNNGLFFPTSGNDQTIIHKGITYKFEVGKPNNFVTTELIVDLTPDLINLVENVVQASPLVNIGHIQEIS